MGTAVDRDRVDGPGRVGSIRPGLEPGEGGFSQFRIVAGTAGDDETEIVACSGNGVFEKPLPAGIEGRAFESKHRNEQYGQKEAVDNELFEFLLGEGTTEVRG